MTGFLHTLVWFSYSPKKGRLLLPDKFIPSSKAKIKVCPNSLDKNFCCCSVTKSCPTLGDPVDCSMPGFPVLHCLREFAQIHILKSVIVANHFILCHPLLLLPSIFPSIRVFSTELAHRIRCQNIRASASASVLPMSIQGWFPLGLTGLISL